MDISILPTFPKCTNLRCACNRPFSSWINPEHFAEEPKPQECDESKGPEEISSSQENTPAVKTPGEGKTVSREFGSFRVCGYFHYRMEVAAQECLEGRDTLTKLWGNFLKDFYPVAYAIASSEADDAGPSLTVRETLGELRKLRNHLDQIERFCLENPEGERLDNGE
jgi:hypothetical protein